MSHIIRGDAARARLNALGRVWQAVGLACFAFGGVHAANGPEEAERSWSEMVNAVAEAADKAAVARRMTVADSGNHTSGYSPEDSSFLAIMNRIVDPLSDAVEVMAELKAMDPFEVKIRQWMRVEALLREIEETCQRGEYFFENLNRNKPG
jgi:hypothetical protein